MEKFTKPFTQQEPIPEEAIASAVAVMRSGRLHRYNTIDGEVSQTALLENEFAEYMGAQYCLACASGGYAIHIALRAAGISKGDAVLCNAFTLSPVPGAIDNAGGRPVLVEISDALKIDTDDLRQKATSSGARFLLLSHMRGHISDMEAVMEICNQLDIIVIEDCAHTLGAKWKGGLSGSFGHIACFSSQTYKHLNSGEGGLLTTSDPDFMARAVLHSGSYMLYGSHLAVPDESVFEQYRLETPNYSGRMDNLRACILRVQLRQLEGNCRRWNLLYGTVEKGLRAIAGITLPPRPQHEEYVGSSIQFSLPGWQAEEVKSFIRQCGLRGVDIKWFGDLIPRAFTSRHESWRYVEQTDLARTDRILDCLCDLRVPLTFDEDDCRQIVAVINEAISQVKTDQRTL
ncbi:MAG: DegT/DnrJ/EryC1/StrS aminotransferase family protein [Planctomycetaceae bacterium]|nr:DegT/DnrJ/EryC1/StrS aminotransferase family protein [Planctomycetaceae bacterium]